MGLGTKSLEGNYNLDPQDQFWSWLRGMAKDHTKGTIFSGFAVEPTDPAGMSVQVGGHSLTPDSAVYYGTGKSGDFFSEHNVLLSSDGVPTKVELSGASTTGDTTYYIVSYVMRASSVAASAQTPGTPELVKTIAVTGAGYGAPTASEIEAAKASGAEPGYIIWGQVVAPQGATTITANNITQANSIANANMRASRGLLYDDSLTNLPYEPPLVHKYEEVPGPYGIRLQCSRWGDFCTVTTFGGCSGNMPSNGTSSEQTPEWCRPWQMQPRCGGAFGGYLGAFWINYSGNLCWVAGGSITKGNSVTIGISWVASPDSRPTS